MSNLGAPRTKKTSIGTAELRIGVMSSAMRMAQHYSVGVVDDVTVEVAQETVDLMGQFPQVLIDSAVVNQTMAIKATLREFSRRNLHVLLGKGMPGNSGNVKASALLTADATAGATELSVSNINGFSTGQILTIWPKDKPEQVTVARLASFTATGAGIYLTGTAQSGGASTIVLAATVDQTDDYFNGAAIEITAGTGAGQVRVISDYTGATDTATVDEAWDTVPDSSSTYLITNGAGTLTLDSTTSTLHAYDSSDEVNVISSQPVAIGDVTAANYFAATVLQEERSTGRPVGFHVWKATIGAGATLQTNAKDFASTELNIKVLRPSAAEYASGGPLYHMRNIIPTHPIGMYFGGAD
jgi:hypothetical protein